VPGAEGCSADLCAADEGKLNGVSVDSCMCAALPERFENSTLTDETVVAAHIDMDSERVEGSVAFYRCGVCGQWWRDGSGDDRALRKVAGINGRRTLTSRRGALSAADECVFVRLACS
jgi:hypothetical protein